jgi:hypothetical protein
MVGVLDDNLLSDPVSKFSGQAQRRRTVEPATATGRPQPLRRKVDLELAPRSTTMLIPGRCHCGNISFTLNWTPEPTRIPARACTCSFCIKHGGVWTSCQAGKLVVRVRDAAQANRYMFGTRTAQFHICAVCGVVPVVTSQIDGRLYGVVSVHAFVGVDPALLQHASASFDGEPEGDRLARRARNWIADVVFETGAG